ncbi:IucA/IucC family protein [Streptomyces nogalater]
MERVDLTPPPARRAAWPTRTRQRRCSTACCGRWPSRSPTPVTAGRTGCRTAGCCGCAPGAGRRPRAVHGRRLAPDRPPGAGQTGRGGAAPAHRAARRRPARRDDRQPGRGRRPAHRPRPDHAPGDPYLRSEQSLLTGHPYHPAPKARGGGPVVSWLPYAPEAHARFPLALLGVREDQVAEEGDTGALDTLGTAPPGYRLLPAHPWQLDLVPRPRPRVRRRPLLRLGTTAFPVWPTAAVRTVYEPRRDLFLKFSLDVRITNDIRGCGGTTSAGCAVPTVPPGAPSLRWDRPRPG